MRHVLLLSMLSAAALTIAVSARAQSPAVPEKLPFDIPYGQPISLADANKVLIAAEAEAKRRQWSYAIAVVDLAGDLVSFVKMDETQLASGELAQRKASTSARFRRATKVFQDTVSGGNATPLSLPGVLAAEGGLPLVMNGKLIGAIGASGGNGAQDGEIAQAGAAALEAGSKAAH